MLDNGLANAFTRWTNWHWELRSFDSWNLVLIADDDLSRQHCLEVVFEGVSYLRCPRIFDAPLPRVAEDAENLLAARIEGHTLQQRPTDLTAYVWEAAIASGDRVRCIVVADTVRVTEGRWPH